MHSLLFVLGASLPLVVGGTSGALLSVPRRALAHALGFATGALIASLAFELMAPAYRDGEHLPVLLAFGAGAAVFVVVDSLLDRMHLSGAAVGFALLAGVTLDGIPENVALGVTLVTGGSPALLVGIFASNLPESLAGSAQMRANGLSSRRCIGIWTAAAVLLGLAVVGGRILLSGVSHQSLAMPLAFAAGAVLASVVDTLAPEAFQRGGPVTALATAVGFGLGTHLALATAGG